MTTVVIEYVALSELPAAWRARLPVSPYARVTVRIEGEAAEQEARPALAGNPLFGMWQDREEAADVAKYARRLRAPRYHADGSHREDWPMLIDTDVLIWMTRGYEGAAARLQTMTRDESGQ